MPLYQPGVTSIIGTANQITASSPTGTVTLSTPQDIATASSPTFSDLTLTGGDLIASTATTFNVFNSVATTVNAFGAATTIAIGAASPTITLGANAVINGGSAANNDLTLQGTSHATRTSSYVILQPNGGNVGIGVTAPTNALEINSNVSTTAQLSGTGDANVFSQIALRSDEATDKTWYMSHRLSNANQLHFVYTPDDSNFYTPIKIAPVAKNEYMVLSATEFVVNDGGLSTIDLRVEGDNDVNLLFTDASADRVGVGTSGPGAKFHVSGSDATANGIEAALELTNTASGGDSWFIRPGATGNTTPAGAISFATGGGYWATINPTSGLTVVGGVFADALFGVDRVPSISHTIGANYSVVVCEIYTIATSTTLTIASNGMMRILAQ